MNSRLIVLAVVVGVVGITLANSLFVVNETQQVLILQFGDHQRTIQSAGLQMRLPFIQNVVYLDRRVLNIDPPVEQVILADQKRLRVDTFARYRIAEPLLFYQSVSTEAVAEQRLKPIINAAVRRVLGNANLIDVLSEGRIAIREGIKQQVNNEAMRLGVEIVDVRIRRADLPEETSQAIYARMRSEREREAAEARAEGQEQAQQIRSRADRERTVILAEARSNAQQVRGDGDEEALTIIANATAIAPGFYEFYRSLEAYRNTFGTGTTSLVLSPQSDFFRFFGNLGQLESPASRETTRTETTAEHQETTDEQQEATDEQATPTE